MVGYPIIRDDDMRHGGVKSIFIIIIIGIWGRGWDA